MEYQKIISLLDNTSNQASKFITKNCVEINDDSRRSYNANSQIKFRNTMLKSRLRDYSNAYILAKGDIKIALYAESPAGRITAQMQTATENDKRNKGVVFKNYSFHKRN